MDGVDQDHDGADGPVVLTQDAATTVLTSTAELEQLGYLVDCSSGPIAGQASGIAVVTHDDSGPSTGHIYVFPGEPLGETSPMDVAVFEVMGEKLDMVGSRGILLPGDLDGDGQGDILAGDPNDRSPEIRTGSVWAWDPTRGGVAGPADAFAWFRGANLEQKGLGRPGRAGDIDGDGLADFWLSEIFNGGEEASVRLYLGADATGTVDVVAAQLRLEIPNQENVIFNRIDSTTDLTGDGIADVLLVDSFWLGGQAAVAAGPISALTADALVTSTTGVADPVPLEGDLGTGHALGDVNGDGQTDLVLGAHVRPGPMGDRQGAAFVFFGPLRGVRSTSEADVAILGEASHQFFGMQIEVTDHNGDGNDDLIVTAPSDPFFGPPRPGLTYVFLGPLHRGEMTGAAADKIYRGMQPGELFGKSLATCDLDRDGDAELVIGAPGDAGHRAAAGRVFVVPGGPF